MKKLTFSRGPGVGMVLSAQKGSVPQANPASSKRQRTEPASGLAKTGVPALHQIVVTTIEAAS